jgi:hypothetical protein
MHMLTSLRNVYVCNSCMPPADQVSCPPKHKWFMRASARLCNCHYTQSISRSIWGRNSPGITLFVVSLPRNYVEPHVLHSVQLTYDSDVSLESPPCVVQPIGQAPFNTPVVSFLDTAKLSRPLSHDCLSWFRSRIHQPRVRRGQHQSERPPSRHSTGTMCVLFR